MWLYFPDAWLNNISFPRNREVIRCSFSIWQNDEFLHWILYWSVNVFNKLDFILKLIYCGEGLAAGRLLFAFALLLMQHCQISLAFKPYTFWNSQDNSHINATTIYAGFKMGPVSYNLYQKRHNGRKQCLTLKCMQSE